MHANVILQNRDGCLKVSTSRRVLLQLSLATFLFSTVFFSLQLAVDILVLHSYKASVVQKSEAVDNLLQRHSQMSIALIFFNPLNVNSYVVEVTRKMLMLFSPVFPQRRSSSLEGVGAC